MTYFVDLGNPENDEISPEELKDRRNKYYAYLESIRDRLPPVAYAFAIADWHYDVSDPRCLHDAWVDRVTLATVPSLRTFKRQSKQHHRTELRVRLLGAYHDGLIELRYVNVQECVLSEDGEWLYDEIRLSEDGRVIYEISFASRKRWLITCENIEYTWKPFAAKTVSPTVPQDS